MVSYDAADVLQEREAMAAIALVLETLDQPAARERVMRWAAEKFHLETWPSTPTLGTVGAPFVEYEFEYDASNDGASNAAAAEQVRGTEPLDALFRELAADLQRLALERHGA
jgi:hypothetical protein